MWLLLAFLITVVTFLSRNKRYRWFYIIAKTYRRDFKVIVGYLQLSIALRRVITKNKSVAAIFSSLVEKHPQKAAFYFEDQVWTFSEVEDFSNKIARYFKNQGFRKGDCVALMLESRPEYPCIWLGLSKIGVITALINTNLVKESLLHSIKSANCKAVIFGSNEAKAIKNILRYLKLEQLYQYHETLQGIVEILPNSTDLKHGLENVSCGQLKEDFEFSINDPLLYIYTSGTTGFPKAAIVTNIRYITISEGLYIGTNLKTNDIIYTPLPFYHTMGSIFGTGGTIVKGLTVAMRKKFSASNYWKDCARYNCTVAHYIGEICRYLLATPQEEPIKHSVRAICGSGLRPKIWRQFVDKFGIKEVYEVYGATEGISNMINIDNTVGSAGFVPRYLQWFYPVNLIKCNDITGEPIRDSKGHCIKCNVGEAGLVISKLMGKKTLFHFQGYVDKTATKKKILHNVFRDGDSYFNSGDILVMDEFGYFFFKDRIGDTFRWKGENVSTCEVEAIISSLVQLNDVAVFGVEIPNTEGRVGMAAIADSKSTLNLGFLGVALKDSLPTYAIPLFIRVLESLPMTGTYKLKKAELQAEGYDLDKIKDKVYFYDSKRGKYVSLTKDLYGKIRTGNLQL